MSRRGNLTKALVITAASVLACIAILVAGCGGDDGGEDASPEEQVRELVAGYQQAGEAGDDAAGCELLTEDARERETLLEECNPFSEAESKALQSEIVDITFYGDDDATVKLANDAQISVEREGDEFLVDNFVAGLAAVPQEQLEGSVPFAKIETELDEALTEQAEEKKVQATPAKCPVSGDVKVGQKFTCTYTADGKPETIKVDVPSRQSVSFQISIAGDTVFVGSTLGPISLGTGE